MSNDSTVNDYLTVQTYTDYANWALAKSSAGISLLNYKSAMALIRCAFFVPTFWWALWERIRTRRFSCSGKANPATSATLFRLASNGGSSQTFTRGHTMPNPTLNTPECRLNDARDTFVKLHGQLDSLITLMFACENLTDINPDDLENNFWLMSDLMLSIEKAYHQTAEVAEEIKA